MSTNIHLVRFLQNPILVSLRLIWQATLQICFALLCLRFQIAALRENFPNCWPTLLLIAGSLALGALRPRSALFAFTLSVPVLVGLAQSTLLTSSSPPSLVFCGVWLGTKVRRILVGSTSPHANADSRALLNGRLEMGLVRLVTDVLITSVMLSLAFQLYKSWHLPDLRTVLFSRAVLGFGDIYYFLTAAFLWLLGLFYFRELMSAAMQKGTDTENGTVSTWIGPMFAVYTVVLVACFFFQVISHIPYAPRQFEGLMLEISLPFEDSHAFGSIAVAVFAYAITTLKKTPLLEALGQWVQIAVILILVIASFSRAAWVVGVMLLLFLAAKTLPWKWTLVSVFVAVAIILSFQFAWRESWIPNPILYRLGNLVRVDQPRLYLYHKAFGMVKDSPLIGHGIGTSYRSSVGFAQVDDPLANVPEFMHNFLLQITTEEGLLIAALYAGLIGLALSRGVTISLAKGQAMHRKHSAISGASVSLVAYLITQMTANSLNVYISNQFFFWFLLAALLGTIPENYLDRDHS